MLCRKVLIALDGSARSELSLSVVPPLMRDGAELCLLRVVRSGDRARADEASDYLRALVERLRRWPVMPSRVSEVVAGGEPSECILETAERESAEAIAVASHGRAGATRLLNGSVAESVVRKSVRPVLIVRSPGADTPAHAESPVPEPRRMPQSVLVPLDSSRASSAALQHAISVARRHDATLHLLGVTTKAKLTMGGGRPRPEHDAPEADASTLHAVASRLRDQGVKAQVHIKTGAPAAVILALADETAADLIALSPRGRAGLPRLALQRVAAQVLRAADAPILWVRAAPASTPSLADAALVGVQG